MGSAPGRRAAGGRDAEGVPRRPGFNVLRSEGGLAVWCESCTNGNTSPVMGSAVYAGGRIVYCLPGNFSHSPNMALVVSEDGEVLRYGRDSLALPGGAELLRFRVPRHGEPWDGAQPSPEPPSPADPLPPAPPAPGVDVEGLVLEIEALGAQPEEAGPAAAIVRARRWTDASTAVAGMMVPKKNQRAKVVLSDRLGRLA